MAFAFDRRAFRGPPGIRPGTMEAFIEHQKISIPDWKHWSWDKDKEPKKRRKRTPTKEELVIQAIIDEIASRY